MHFFFVTMKERYHADKCQIHIQSHTSTVCTFLDKNVINLGLRNKEKSKEPRFLPVYIVYIVFVIVCHQNAVQHDIQNNTKGWTNF